MNKKKLTTIISIIAAIILVFLGVDPADIIPDFGLSGSQIYENESTTELPDSIEVTTDSVRSINYRFYSNELKVQHFNKHGKEMGFTSADEYEAGANVVIDNPNALHKTEKEDGDDVYYLEATNELVIVSTKGYIRTYFCPDAGIKYFNKQ